MSDLNKKKGRMTANSKEHLNFSILKSVGMPERSLLEKLLCFKHLIKSQSLLYGSHHSCATFKNLLGSVIKSIMRILVCK